MIRPAARRITHLNDSCHSAELIQLTDAAGPVLLRTCRYEIHFEIAAGDGRTGIGFAHVGLVPEYECFDVCSNSWDFYLYTSLRALICTGHGLPNCKEQAASA
jgi:hypothetical protein